MNILCITPIIHLKNVKSILDSKGNVFYLPYSNKENIIDFIKSNKIDTIFTNPNKQNFILDKSIIDLGIKTICTASTGLNHIDMEYCNSKGVEVLSLTRDYEFIRTIPATAEHAFALTLSLIRNIPSSFQSVKDGKWDYGPFIGRQLKDLQFGVVGYGRLGRMYCNYVQAFSSKEILICDPYVSEHNTNLHEVFELCEVISLHVHVNEETKGMINKDIIKNPCYIINTSRGDIVNEDDIIDAIERKAILGYAADVVSDEFGEFHNSSIIKASKKYDNIIITPHIGGMTVESQNQAFERAAHKL